LRRDSAGHYYIYDYFTINSGYYFLTGIDGCRGK
jgi:hypothetical protein